MVDLFTAEQEHKFTFGFWTEGKVGRERFGEPVRMKLTPDEIVHKSAEVGVYGVNLHDNDLIPIGAVQGKRGWAYEHIDQITSELLLGVH
ncbi:hypothetical protein ACFLUA_01260 [Chloroflexota bacterium]